MCVHTVSIAAEVPHLKLSGVNLWTHIVGEVKGYYKYTIEQ